MGALKNVGIDLSTESFQNSFITSVHDNIAAGVSPEIPSINLTFGFGVELPTGAIAETNATKFKESALKSDSEFRNNFIPGIEPIFDLLDTIPAINILKGIGITDPTAPILPIINTVTEILATAGIPNPNQFLATKLPQFIAAQEDILKMVNKIATGSEAVVSAAVDKLSRDLASILGEESTISLDTLEATIEDNVEKIKALANLEVPELEIPNITDFIEFLGLKIPNLPELPALTNVPNMEQPQLPSPDDIISMFFNFELEIPPLGVMFVEIVKVKLEMLLELAAGIPSWLADAVDKIKELFLSGFNLNEMLKAVAESVFNYFFEKINATKIKNVIDKAPSLVSALHETVLVLVGSLVTLFVGILLGEGLIMKSSAIALGIIK